MGYINEMERRLVVKKDGFILWRFHGEEGIRNEIELTGIEHGWVGA